MVRFLLKRWLTMTNGNLRALGLAALLAVTTFGCATTSVSPATTQSDGEPPTHSQAERSKWEDRAFAERMFGAMLDRCHEGRADSASTLSYCIAATNIATNVMQDEARTAHVQRYRCAKLGKRDEGNPVCSAIREAPAPTLVSIEE